MPGDADLEVVGESFYQDALWRLSGARRGEPVRQTIVAVLVPEPQNPHDPNAVRVDINGQQVGHLSASDALQYGDGLRALMARSGGLIGLGGVIVGGGRGRPSLGVWLSHNPIDFGVKSAAGAGASFTSQEMPSGSIRTGFSEAWISDLSDDSYDLSWHNELPGDDALAVEKLQQLLKVDPDPIDRHFMFNELEKRLYRFGLTDATAMVEFDNACRVHDEEMQTIRSSFIAKWDTVPFLSLYKQMAIRQQKAKDWELCRWWTERGIQVYGDKAARPEWVEDLEARLDRARGKLEPSTGSGGASRTKPAGRSNDPVSPVPSSMETLTCSRCGSQFERMRTRGRKPLLCPSCRN